MRTHGSHARSFDALFNVLHEPGETMKYVLLETNDNVVATEGVMPVSKVASEKVRVSEVEERQRKLILIWREVMLPMAKEFTRAYREHLDDPVAVREGYCLMAQYPAICLPITENDIFAGRKLYRPLVGFSAELNANKSYPVLGDPVGYTPAKEDEYIRKRLGICNSGFAHNHGGLMELAETYETGSPEREEIVEMVAFWDKHSLRTRYNELLTDEVLQAMSRTTGFDTYHISGFPRQDCYSLDYDKLLQLGVPGLRALIREKRKSAKDPGFHDGLLLALDVVANVSRYYEKQAREMLATSANPERQAQLRAMADALAHISEKKPETLRQAIQLFLLYNLVSDSPNYGRMDQYLGDFYCHDIDNGRLSEQEALELLCGLWYMISQICPEGGPTQPNARLVVGGKGRRNETNANRFAMAAMEATRRMRVDEPNLTLRFCKGQDPRLMEKAITVLGEGCVHPGLYNDDEHIPMVRDWFHVPEKDAEQYLPEGCGEILIDHMGFGSPNNIHIFPAALDLVLHNGYDRFHKEQRGLRLGELSSFDTFEKLLAAFEKQVDYNYRILAKRHAAEHQAEAEKAAFLFMSMLSDDCIERGKSLFNGGVRYLGGIIETFGLTNVSDSLVAIRELVYEKRIMALEKLVSILDADFVGYEKERKLMLDRPKFGNDDDRADALHTYLSERVCKSADIAGRAEGLRFFLNCNLNPGGIYYSDYTGASADGRKMGDPMAMGNAPTAGRDKSGITALLNSMTKHPKCHAGYVQNLKVNRTMFTPENRPCFEALLHTYFNNGGIQLMVTSINRGDLENALREPEKYQSLQVRVAGWTGHFVKLPSKYQQEILNRTFY